MKGYLAFTTMLLSMKAGMAMVSTKTTTPEFCIWFGTAVYGMALLFDLAA